VVENSPADKAGLRVGAAVDIGLVRDGKSMRVTAVIAAASGH
jgi:hypothetical protein